MSAAPSTPSGDPIVLITALNLADLGGSSMYVRDLAIELLGLGYRPVVYSPRLGPVADQLHDATVPVLDDLRHLSDPPGIIHGNHTIETAEAVLRFPGVPAVFTCHGWDAWMAEPPELSTVAYFIGVNDACRDRVNVGHGIPIERCRVIPNGVDTHRFALRQEPLPDTPTRAAVFSNTATEGEFVDAARRACESRGIELATIGRGMGNPDPHPERVLGTFHVVFARGRCALEAMSTGASVIVADEEGMGPAISLENIDALRMDGLGRRLLTRPHDLEAIGASLDAYDAGMATQIALHVRDTASLKSTTREVIEVYDLARAAAPAADWSSDVRWVIDHLAAWSLLGHERDEVVHARHVLAQHTQSLADRLEATDRLRIAAVEDAESAADQLAASEDERVSAIDHALALETELTTVRQTLPDRIRARLRHLRARHTPI